MSILMKMAWRNIWRNIRRTAVLIGTIAIGLFGYLGSMAFNKGFLYQMLESSINLNAAHIQISTKGFHKNPSIHSRIREPQQIGDVLQGITGIDYAPQVRFQGMINSSEASSGVMITGVVPEREARITIVSQLVQDGSYLAAGSAEENEIVIGAGLAKRLNVRVGEKLVLMAHSLSNEIASAAFRVSGIFQSVSSDFDRSVVFIHIEDARQLVGYGDAVSAFAVRLPRAADLNTMAATLRERLNTEQLEVLTWEDRFPVLVVSIESFRYFSLLFIAIIFSAVAFSIINAYLMVIYERIREIGIMMAMGVLPRKIRAMLVYESAFISLLGAVAGSALGALFVLYFNHHGLDLSVFAEGLAKWGVGARLHPQLDAEDWIIGWFGVCALVLLATLYPAIKASRFKTVDAIHYDH